MIESGRGRRSLRLLLAGAGFGLLLASGWSAASAQDAARPTGEFVLNRLDAAKQALAARAGTQPELGLAAVAQRLGQMGDALRKQLGSAVAEPVEIMPDQAKAAAQRVDAAAQRSQAYLQASTGCRGSDAKALAAALALAVEQLAAAPASGKPAQPVIDAVETPDHQPLFVIHADDRPLAFDVLGANLLDTQCANPQVRLTDGQGKPIAAQPVITGISPQHIALKLADRSGLQPGAYLLHVVPERKAFLVGCTKQPEAVAALQVAPPLQVTIDYTLTASCRANGAGQAQVTLGHGSLPVITRRGATVSQPIDTAACPDPASYTVSVTAHFEGGDQASAGPVTQPADAGITAGLPGGLSVNWNPAIRTLFASAAAHVCRGAD